MTGPRLVNLAQPRLGAAVVHATDDFFADKSRLIDPAEPVFVPGKYDQNGKWMDGWESRRKRGAGHDHCTIRLGRPGRIFRVEIDTRHFTGNFPPAASVSACRSEAAVPAASAVWTEIVPPMALAGDDRAFVDLAGNVAWTHVRLHLYPDGGVARLRLWGLVAADLDRLAPPLDLAALLNGGRAVAANDEHFGALENILAPGRSETMADGWETRRRREPGYDWGLIALATPGIVDEVLVDTGHFKGNFPHEVSLQAAHVSDLPDIALPAQAHYWPLLLPPQRLSADAEHRFRDALADIGPVSHVRVNLHPDGGISRLRLFGRPG